MKLVDKMEVGKYYALYIAVYRQAGCTYWLLKCKGIDDMYSSDTKPGFHCEVYRDIENLKLSHHDNPIEAFVWNYVIDSSFSHLYELDKNEIIDHILVESL